MLTSGFFHFFFCVLQDLIDLVACITYLLYYFSKYRQFFTHKLNIGIVVATMWTFNDMNITNSINKDHRKSDHIRQTWQLLILLMANIIFVTWRSFYCSTPKWKMINYFSFFTISTLDYSKYWYRNRLIRYQILESKSMCWYALKYYIANDENIYWGYWFGHLCQWIAVLDEPNIIWAIVLGQHEHIT